MFASAHARACTVTCTCSLLTRASARVRCAGDHGSSCCAAFALGATSGTACPSSYARLDTADACKSAADAASRTYGGSVAYSYHPYGCYWHTIAGSVYYNSNASGADNAFSQPLCAGAVPTPRGSRARSS